MNWQWPNNVLENIDDIVVIWHWINRYTRVLDKIVATWHSKGWVTVLDGGSIYSQWWLRSIHGTEFCSPDIRRTAPFLLDTHSAQHSVKDTRKAHFSNKLRRFRDLAKAHTLRKDMLTCNNRITSQHDAAILNETKLVARSDRWFKAWSEDRR